VIVAQGSEAGGHTGEISTMVLVPQVVDAVDVPVLAAGGIAGGRQMAAALALVAIGVLIGRSFGPAQVVQTASSQPSATDVIPAALRDANYRKQRDVLLVEVQHKLESMPAAERAKVGASLATLRRSIGEIEAALGRDPANALLQELLVNSVQEEMRALTAVRDSGNQEI
jgi:NAD(P)H-dependent flavin oxidoreductase YrpB (nitropropane dioxygenase family)